MYEDELLRITHMLESIIEDLEKTIKYVYSLQILIDATEDKADEPAKIDAKSDLSNDQLQLMYTFFSASRDSIVRMYNDYNDPLLKRGLHSITQNYNAIIASINDMMHTQRTDNDDDDNLSDGSVPF